MAAWILLAVVCCLVAARAHAASVSVIADGFTWVENLAFDGRGAAFVSDLVHGTITRLALNATTQAYDKTLWASGFKKVLGLSVDPSAPQIMYAVGDSLDGKPFVAMVGTDEPQQIKILIPDLGNGTGNGLGVYHANGLVYTSTEGTFLPNGGLVYEIDPVAATFRILKHGLWAADGLWIDQVAGLLYVGQLFARSVWVYDLARGVDLGIQVKGLPSGLLDDFCLSSDRQSILGCDWLNGSIVSFPAYQSAAGVSVVATGLGHPTSARLGSGPGFEGSLIVTEGSGLLPAQHASRVFKVKL